MNLSTFLFRSHSLILVAATAFIVGCEKPTSSSDSGFNELVDLVDKPKTSYPFERTLKDNQGRPLEGTIIGKKGNLLYVIRSADRMNFEIPIENLSPADAEFARELPEAIPPQTSSASEEASKGNGAEAPYVQNRLEAIAQLEKKNELLAIEIQATSNGMLQRSKESEIERNTREIVELKSAIELYRAQND